MFVATALTTGRIAHVTAMALEVASKPGGRITFEMPKFTATAGKSFDDRSGSEGRKRRWAAAYFQSLRVFNLPDGTVYVPCYLCKDGALFDAWTMDGEHVDPIAGSTIANLLLSCSKCNQVDKRDHGRVHDSVIDLLTVMAYGVLYPRGSASILGMWHARKRRRPGDHSTPYPG